MIASTQSLTRLTALIDHPEGLVDEGHDVRLLVHLGLGGRPCVARAYESASSLNFILSRSFIVLIYFYFNNFDSNKGMDSHKETVK